MGKSTRRVPKGYDGTAVTSRSFSELLPQVLAQVHEAYSERPDLILATWPEVIGPNIAPMTEATGFSDGILYVKVKNSTLYSLLCRRDKQEVLRRLRKRFPKVEIENIVFRIG